MRLRRGDGGDPHIGALLADLGGRVEPPTEDDLRELARSVASTPRSLPARRRSHGSLRWPAAATVALLLVGGIGFALGAWTAPSGTAGTSSAGVGFLPAKGWTVVQGGRLARTGAPTAIAANVPLDPDDGLRDVPFATLEALPPTGVLISTRFSVRGDPAQDPDFPAQRLPLQFSAADPVSSSTDPLPLARPLARYRLRAGVGRYNVDARIFFGVPRPSAAQRTLAQSQLDRLVVSAERVTLFARPTVHNRNQSITLLGSVDSGSADEEVTIEAKECGQTSFRPVAGAHTLAGGGWTMQFAPTITTTLRAEWKGARSATVTIQERAWVQLSTRPRTAKGFGFEVAVRSRLQFWRRHVIVQRFERRLGQWRNLKKVVLTETGAAPGSTFVWSSADFRVAVPKGTVVRAVFPLSQARPCYLAGYSNQLRT